ncbi:hydroxymethylbilane synthase [Sphingobium algorifonticola]|uniref:Porphobilinogen deaminase n=1 Tax=Sphingobium algorifonticola TaxID=2008318 RepID=A0A437JD16_9SPHN|nr:hydroxymethylbilane synthase [Sphingobium algorifonticola]RVT43643.1 hydroxymethylbilane synthase [Sphingobium algorifonticola]
MVEQSPPLRLGTRGSPLALVQANMVANALCAAHGWPSEAIKIVTVKTSGDRIQDRALADIGGKALWTKELDRALIDRDIDFAVHSMKDVETVRPSEIMIAAMLPRADVRDRLIGAESLADLRQGAVLGTSSPRRSAQVRRLRPDITTTLFRGNVATRLAKVTAGEVDATLLAAAGLDRLGQQDIGHAIALDVMMPAPAQGAVGIETLADNARMQGYLAAISDADTYDCVMAERALLLALGGNCHSPIGALARIEGDGILLIAEILTGDGSEHVSDSALFLRDDPAAASALGQALLRKASPAIRALFDGATDLPQEASA